MKIQYKNTFIYKVCKTLNIDMKELAFMLSKGLKQIENYRKDEENIPPREKQYMRLLMENKELQNKIIKLQKHTVVTNHVIKGELNGITKITIEVKGLKSLIDYIVILEEK